ncbi:MAG: cytochrome c [Acidimicrobiia bacterium]|jgi:mono/diheme cytochrome c family protein
MLKVQFLAHKLSRITGALVAGFLMVLTLSACATDESPEVPSSNGTTDPVLEQGRSVFSSNCARCHGSSGGGGAGVKLSQGRAVELHPDIATMIEVVTNGKNGMPSFGKALSEAEIEAVVRYVREVL